MDTRRAVPDLHRAMVALDDAVSLDPALRELVRLRASLINGCAFCIDMHWTALGRDGESEVRLAQLAAWEESPFFDERERAALALTEAVTRLADRAEQVPDPIWDAAAEHFDEVQLGALVLDIATVNLWNRLNVATQQVVGEQAV